MNLNAICYEFDDACTDSAQNTLQVRSCQANRIAISNVRRGIKT